VPPFSPVAGAEVKQHVRTIAAAEVLCRAFAGVPPMLKLADAVARLLLTVSTAVPFLRSVSCLRMSEPLR
jgi:hypothetical protein